MKKWWFLLLFFGASLFLYSDESFEGDLTSAVKIPFKKTAEDGDLYASLVILEKSGVEIDVVWAILQIGYYGRKDVLTLNWWQKNDSTHRIATVFALVRFLKSEEEREKTFAMFLGHSQRFEKSEREARIQEIEYVRSRFKTLLSIDQLSIFLAEK